jgi:hypothetical protein
MKRTKERKKEPADSGRKSNKFEKRLRTEISKEYTCLKSLRY